MTDAEKIAALTALVEVLHSGMKIVRGHFINSVPEPHPGATASVIHTSLFAVELSRSTGLLPEKVDRA